RALVEGEPVRLRQLLYFFFQAEDGIRDLTVTGVQTCALPIYRLRRPPSVSPSLRGRACTHPSRRARVARRRSRSHSTCCAPDARSEERRVGKECGYGWWAEDAKNKDHHAGAGGVCVQDMAGHT